MFARAEFNKSSDPLERLYEFLDFIAQAGCGPGQVQGCLIGNLTQELANTHPQFRACCAEKLNGFAGHIQTMLREAGAKHGTKAAFDPESVATLFVSLMQGSLLLAKARQDKSVLAENVAHFRAYLDTLFGKSKRR